MSPIKGKINHQYNSGFEKYLSMAVFTPDARKVGKNRCNIRK
jgi:hypothetical protein